MRGSLANIVLVLFVSILLPFYVMPPAGIAAENDSETKYLIFQIFSFNNEEFPPPSAIESTVQDIKTVIGVSGDKKHKLGFAVGPLTFDNTDQEISHLIRTSFTIADAEDVAVAFHIDDSMFFGTRKDLLANPDNIEWLDWNKTPNTGRRIDWSAAPSKLVPQMCLNSVEVKNAVVQRADLIGKEIKKALEALSIKGKEELFAGVIAGWETQIGKDFETGRSLGYCALSGRGFSSDHPPEDIDAERVSILKEFIELWAKELAKAGIPKEKIYAHIAFSPKEGSEDDSKLDQSSYAESVNFAVPEVAFSSYYRPGFSTYPAPGLFEAIYEESAKHGNAPWASCEGTNVIPNGFPGEATMETYLSRMFNHGAALVNIFSWGIGGDEQKNKNIFRLATENPEALSAYKKFLSGSILKEETLESSPLVIFQEKMHKIQRELPLWIERTQRQDLAAPLMRQLDALIKRGAYEEANQIADKVLALINQK